MLTLKNAITILLALSLASHASAFKLSVQQYADADCNYFNHARSFKNAVSPPSLHDNGGCTSLNGKPFRAYNLGTSLSDHLYDQVEEQYCEIYAWSNTECSGDPQSVYEDVIRHIVGDPSASCVSTSKKPGATTVDPFGGVTLNSMRMSCAPRKEVDEAQAKGGGDWPKEIQTVGRLAKLDGCFVGTTVCPKVPSKGDYKAAAVKGLITD